MATKSKIIDVYFQTNENYTIRTESFNGRDHLVVPVVMMTEGVRCGSGGPTLHLAEELGRYPESWDGIPATIGHPRVNNAYVSANSPDVLSDWATGYVFNAKMDKDKLRAEVWCCLEDLERISEATLEKLNNNEVIEVSIGIFSDEEDSEGIWEGTSYQTIARNYRPDHLALLPDQIGACSIEDGCGIRVNKKGESKVTKKKLILNAENQVAVLKEFNQKGFSINEMGHNELDDKIRSAVYGLEAGHFDNYVDEIYADYVVFRQCNYRVTPTERKLYKQSYTVDGSDNIVLIGDATLVKREVTYVAIPEVTTNGRKKTKRIIKKNVIMANEGCTACVQKLAANLIANKNTAWTKDDTAYLEAQSEECLEKMTPQSGKTDEGVKVNTDPKESVTREGILNVLSSLTKEEFMQIAPEEVSAQIVESEVIVANQRTTMASEIIANTEVYTEEELNSKSIADLRKIHKLATNGSAFAIGGGGMGGTTHISNNGRSKSGKATMLPSCVKQ